LLRSYRLVSNTKSFFVGTPAVDVPVGFFVSEIEGCVSLIELADEVEVFGDAVILIRHEVRHFLGSVRITVSDVKPI